MVNLFQRLMNDKKEPTEAELDLLIYGKQPKIDTRTADYAENMGETQQPTGNKLANFLLGTPVPQNESVGTTTDDNGNVIQSANISNPLREGGVLRDIANGYRENVNQNFSLDNWGQGNKNIATKIGEGLGSTAKFLESPAGRALLMAGAVGLTGGNGLQALTFGATAGAKNQSNRMADKLYRDDLQAQGINTEGLRGYINDNAYQNMLRSKQLQDNAAYREMYYNTMLQKQNEDLEFRRQQAEEQRKEKQLERQLQYEELGERRRQNNLNYQLGKEKLIADLGKNGGENYSDVEAQLNNFQNSFKNVNNPYRYRLAGGASEFLNTLTPQEANFNSQRTLLFNQIARKLGGEKGVLSDQDIKRIDAALPKLSDTQAQKEAKMKAVYALLDIKKGGGNVDRLGIL